jgi:hypothetical protein
MEKKKKIQGHPSFLDCIMCGTEMICTNDVNEEMYRIDFVDCPKCKSQATVIYEDRGKVVSRIEWRRGEQTKLVPKVNREEVFDLIESVVDQLDNVVKETIDNVSENLEEDHQENDKIISRYRRKARKLLGMDLPDEVVFLVSDSGSIEMHRDAMEEGKEITVYDWNKGYTGKIVEVRPLTKRQHAIGVLVRESWEREMKKDDIRTGG